MAKEIIIEDQQTDKILLGSVSLFILVILIGFEQWTTWFSEKLISGLLSVFFIAPLFGAILNRRLPREMTLMLLVGGLSIIIYKSFTGISWYGLSILMVKSFTAVTLFSVALEILYKFGTRKLPPL